MKDCIHCTNPIEDDAPFCPHCGRTQEAPKRTEPEFEPRVQTSPPPPPPESKPQESEPDDMDDMFDEAFSSGPPEPQMREPSPPGGDSRRTSNPFRSTKKPFKKNRPSHSELKSKHLMRNFKSNIVQSVLVTMFCCQPVGIIAIILSVLAINEKNKGEMTQAHKYARYSRNATSAAIVLGILTVLGGISGICG